MEIVDVVPEGCVVFLENVETLDPIEALLLFSHVRCDGTCEIFAVVLVHRQGKVLPTVSPCCKTPASGVCGKEVRLPTFMYSFAVTFATTITQVGAANAENTFIVPVSRQQFFTVREEIETRYGIFH